MTLAADTLPGNSGYVAAAYLVFFALALIYFGIMAAKLSRLEQDLVELNELADRFEGRRAAEVVAEETHAIAEKELPA